jgi:hypothetical protein
MNFLRKEGNDAKGGDARGHVKVGARKHVKVSEKVGAKERADIRVDNT